MSKSGHYAYNEQLQLTNSANPFYKEIGENLAMAPIEANLGSNTSGKNPNLAGADTNKANIENCEEIQLKSQIENVLQESIQIGGGYNNPYAVGKNPKDDPQNINAMDNYPNFQEDDSQSIAEIDNILYDKSNQKIHN